MDKGLSSDGYVCSVSFKPLKRQPPRGTAYIENLSAINNKHTVVVAVSGNEEHVVVLWEI